MEMHVRKSLHPLWWITGIAVILFSAAGIAAIMGWIPTSTGTSGNKAAYETLGPDTAKSADPKSQRAPVQAASKRTGTEASMAAEAAQAVSEMAAMQMPRSAEKTRPRKRSSVYFWSRVVENTQMVEPPACATITHNAAGPSE